MQRLLKYRDEVNHLVRKANLDSRPKIEFHEDRFFTYGGKSLYPFKLRPYQKEDLLSFRNKNEPKNNYNRTARRGGKDSFCWPLMIDEALRVSGNYLYVLITLKQAKKVIWNGGMQDRVNGKIVRFLDMIPSGEISRIDRQELFIELKNGSIIYLGGANHPDRDRGMTLNGAVYSEFDFYPSYEIYHMMQPIFAESGGWQYIISTPKEFGYATKLYDRLKTEDNWRITCRTVDDLVDENGERYISEDAVNEAIASANMPEWKVRREFYCEPALDSTTLYFALEMNDMQEEGRSENAVLPDARKPIHFSMDLGSDGTPIIGFQVDVSGKIDIVFYQKPTKEVHTYSWYWDLMKEFVFKHRLSMGRLVLPHDSVKRQISESKISSAYSDFSNLGADVVKLRRVGNKDSLINLAKAYLPKIHIDKGKGQHLIEALCAYSRKYDADKDVFGSKPNHDWASHPSDCLQYMCQAIEEGHLVTRSRMPQKYRLVT